MTITPEQIAAWRALDQTERDSAVARAYQVVLSAWHGLGAPAGLRTDMLGDLLVVALMLEQIIPVPEVA